MNIDFNSATLWIFITIFLIFNIWATVYFFSKQDDWKKYDYTYEQDGETYRVQGFARGGNSFINKIK